MICELCGESLEEQDRSPLRPLMAHQECAVRSVMGGIGHHLNHDYWCLEVGDPDAGLSFRESARQVWRLVVEGERT